MPYQRVNDHLTVAKKIAFSVLVGILLTGCGKRGALVSQGPECDRHYPRTYPAE